MGGARVIRKWDRLRRAKRLPSETTPSGAAAQYPARRGDARTDASSTAIAVELVDAPEGAGLEEGGVEPVVERAGHVPGTSARLAAELDDLEAEATSALVHLAPSPVEQPPAEVLAQLPAPGDVYEHLFSQLSTRTREAYEGDLAALAAWLQLSSSRAAVGYVLSLAPERAQAVGLGWLVHMRDGEHLAPATLSRRLAAVQSVLRVARNLGVISWTLGVKAPKGPGLRDTSGFAPDNARRLLAACGEGMVGLRNELVVRMLFVMALRRVEISRIRVEHFDGKRVLVHGKGHERNADKIKWVTLTSKMAKLVARWIKEMKRQHGQPLLCGWRNKSQTRGLTPHGIGAIAKALKVRAELEVGANPHQYRHAAVNTLIDRDVSLSVAQSLLRHDDPRTTSGYFSNRDDAALQASALLEQILDGDEGA